MVQASVLRVLRVVPAVEQQPPANARQGLRWAEVRAAGVAAAGGLSEALHETGRPCHASALQSRRQGPDESEFKQQLVAAPLSPPRRRVLRVRSR